LYDVVKQEIKSKPRMADFAIYGECISRALGYPEMTFLDKYDEKISSITDDVVEKYPIIPIIQDLIKKTGFYENEISSFFFEVKDKLSHKYNDSMQYIRFPKAANKVWDHITVIKPNLRELGIEINIQKYTKSDTKHRKNNKIIYISQIKENPVNSCNDASSLPSLPSLQKQNQEQNNVSIGKDNGNHNVFSQIGALPTQSKFTNSLMNSNHSNRSKDKSTTSPDSHPIDDLVM
jgi:hypothetical protein